MRKGGEMKKRPEVKEEVVKEEVVEKVEVKPTWSPFKLKTKVVIEPASEAPEPPSLPTVLNHLLSIIRKVD
jgi:hypothetical protein